MTIMDILLQLLMQEDPDVAGEVAQILREDSIEILLEANTLQAEQTEARQVQLTIKSPEGARVLTGSHLLVVAGRVPNSVGETWKQPGFKQFNAALSK